MHIALPDEPPGPLDVSITGWQELFGGDGAPLPTGSYDLEGLAAHEQILFISSEGDVTRNIEPFIAVFGPDRSMMERLAIPSGFIPDADLAVGIRNNLAFEALTITPDGRWLFTATESALVQDGPVATPDAGTTGRILRFDRTHGVFDAQFFYPIDAVHARAPVPGALEVNGVVEMLALAEDHLLVLERSFVAGAVPEHSIQLFDVCLAGATDVSAIDSLSLAEAAAVPAGKRLIGDLADFVPRLDNIEGMAFGPRLQTGEHTIIFISDNNFAPQRQITQVLAFSLSGEAIAGCAAR